MTLRELKDDIFGKLKEGEKELEDGEKSYRSIHKSKKKEEDRRKHSE
eukprot:CAMPEP_0170568278 /NCGR_PEP_ID=MMETSP0211-20121228/81070_1 /TAXON_ID=311385 /ORGANISM="Pseudokeronopsis sp., Strain OXSARD2" /LENGTH=46 /DNA_ID= /DNA_START= /DNA_END= /DNA_ORIENTATION=